MPSYHTSVGEPCFARTAFLNTYLDNTIHHGLPKMQPQLVVRFGLTILFGAAISTALTVPTPVTALSRNAGRTGSTNTAKTVPAVYYRSTRELAVPPSEGTHHVARRSDNGRENAGATQGMYNDTWDR